MARDEAPREDLLAEATALVRRGAILPHDADPGAEPLVAGFRRDGGLSLYFGQDPVYHFNSAGQLRRAFVAGRLVKAQHGRLAALQRQRRAHEVALLRRELDDQATKRFLADLYQRLAALARLLDSGQYTLVGQVPSAGAIADELAAWLAANSRPAVADAPHSR